MIKSSHNIQYFVHWSAMTEKKHVTTKWRRTGCCRGCNLLWIKCPTFCLYFLMLITQSSWPKCKTMWHYPDWRRSARWLESWEELLFSTDPLTTCEEAIFIVKLTWLKRWLLHRLWKRQLQTTVLLRTPITKMIFFNQGTVCYSWIQTVFLNILGKDWATKGNFSKSLK